MHKFILLTFLIISVILICLIMLQQEKSADIKSSFNSNYTMNNLFSPRNTESSINKMIKILASLFIFISLILNNFSNSYIKNKKWQNLDEHYLQDKNINNVKNKNLSK